MVELPQRVADEEALRRRLEGLRRSPEYAVYERVRAEVLRLLARTGRDEEGDSPSAYWREELAGFEYMLDASPLIVSKLRHHTFHVTGLRTYEYRSHKERAAQKLEARLDALLEAAGGPELLVPEARELGGFGFEIRGELYNVDTLKYFEALIALERSGALSGFRRAEPRPVAVEIGAGWGGFAYQFKRLFPRATYVLVDLPELFLFSAVYLLTLFPGARAVFFDPAADQPLRDVEFVFVANHDFGRLELDADLTVNMVSFQEMTDRQVEAYVERTYARGCPLLYSLNRDRSLYNPELSNVRELIARRYELEELTVLEDDYAKAVKTWSKGNRLSGRKKKPQKPDELPYRHVLGRRRDRDGGAAA